MLMTQGRSLGTDLMKANLEQLRDAILASDSVTPLEFAEDLARLDQEDFMTPSPVMWSVAARRPCDPRQIASPSTPKEARRGEMNVGCI